MINYYSPKKNFLLLNYFHTIHKNKIPAIEYTNKYSLAIRQLIILFAIWRTLDLMFTVDLSWKKLNLLHSFRWIQQCCLCSVFCFSFYQWVRSSGAPPEQKSPNGHFKCLDKTGCGFLCNRCRSACMSHLKNLLSSLFRSIEVLFMQ